MSSGAESYWNMFQKQYSKTFNAIIKPKTIEEVTSNNSTKKNPVIMALGKSFF
jgi:hypothetical protein